MREDEFSLLKMEEELAQLPPSPGDLGSYTPWRAAMDKVLWGMVLIIFRLGFFYLQYILPLLGSALLYLGYRSLRRENRWFRLCWVLAGALLAVHMATDILAATPVIGWITANPAADFGLGLAQSMVGLVLLFSLWRGTRAAFAAVGEARPRDWLKLGLICQLLSLALALWGTFYPYTEPSIFGVSIIEQYEWLYYGRSIAALVLQICLLVCIAKQSGVLAGRGYDITPAPVRVSAGPFLLGVFALVLLALPPALWISSHIPTGPGEPVSILDTEHRQIRARLMELGLPVDIAAALDGAELERCAGAAAVAQAVVYDRPQQIISADGGGVSALDGGMAELSSWIIFLPGDQVRQIHFFRYVQLPRLRLQEQFSADPSGNYDACDFDGRLVWEGEGETTFALTPEIRLGGGQGPEEVEENLGSYLLPETIQMEVERLGHLHYTPYFNFAIPEGAENLRGYLAYTVENASRFPSPADIHTDDPDSWTFGDTWTVYLRHQNRWLHYPFLSISDLGGTAYTGADTIQSAYGMFAYYS